MGILTARVDRLTLGDDSWARLQDRPVAAYAIACGVVNFMDGRRGVLSIGGSPVTGIPFDSAFFLDFSTLTWSPVPSFNAPDVAIGGTLVQWGNLIHFLPLEEGNPKNSSVSHYVKDIANPNQAWITRDTKHGFPSKVLHLPWKVLSFFNSV